MVTIPAPGAQTGDVSGENAGLELRQLVGRHEVVEGCIRNQVPDVFPDRTLAHEGPINECYPTVRPANEILGPEVQMAEDPVL